MTLPKQVQAQADEAERIEKAIEEASKPAETVIETPPAEAAKPEEQKKEPEAQPATPTPEPQAETPKPEVNEATWERRFKTLQGKYNAEVPRLNADLKELRAQVASLTEKLTAKPAEPEKPLVTDKDVETFGGDLIDVIDRKAREVASKMVNAETARLEAENRELREQIEGVTERQVSTSKQAFFAELSRQVPDWEVMNADDGFLNWLAEPDPLSGQVRQEYLESAVHTNDVTRTAALFSAYKQLTAPPPQTVVPDTRKELERQVAPGTSKVSATHSPPAAEKVWTTSEINTFFTDVAKGKYRDNPQEVQRIEQEIDLAVAAGRIRA